MSLGIWQSFNNRRKPVLLKRIGAFLIQALLSARNHARGVNPGTGMLLSQILLFSVDKRRTLGWSSFIETLPCIRRLAAIDGRAVLLDCETSLNAVEAAEILMVSRPRVSDVVKKTAKFTIDTLVEMLSRAGKPVKLAIS